MGMKSRSASRFGRLRRFFKHTLMGSPRSAGIRGTGEILLALYSATLLVFLSIPVFSSGGIWYHVMTVMVFVPLFLLLSGVCRFVPAFFRLFVKKKKFCRYGLLIVLAFGFFCCYPVFDFNLIGVYLLTVAGFILSGNRRKIRKQAYIPGIILAALIALLCAAEILLGVYTDAAQCRLVKTTGNLCHCEAVRQQLAAGFQITSEPLKSVLKLAPENTPLDITLPKHKLSVELEKYRRKNSAFISALEDFLKLDVKYIGRVFDENDLLYFEISGAKELRESFSYLDMTIRSYPEDPARVKSAHAGMVKLRGIALETPDILLNAMGVGFEKKRLHSIASTLGTTAWGREEYFAITGDAPDWKRVFLHCIATEAAVFDSLGGHLQGLGRSDRKIYPTIDWLPWCFSRQFRVYLLANQLAFLKAQQLISDTVILNADLSGKELCAKLPSADKLSGFLIFDFIKRDWCAFLRRCIMIQDHRRMAEIAYEVMEHRWSRGELPRDLAFLGEVPHSCWDGKPFLYSCGELKDKDGKRFSGFRISLQDEPLVNCLEVRLDPTAVQNGCSKQTGSLAL